MNLGWTIFKMFFFFGVDICNYQSVSSCKNNKNLTIDGVIRVVRISWMYFYLEMNTKKGSRI